MKPLLLFFFFLLSGCTHPLSFSPGLMVSSQGSPPARAANDTAQPEVALGVFYTTIGEVLTHPVLFAGQKIRLKGKTAGVQHLGARPDITTTTFDLVAESGKKVKVETGEHVSVREGQIVTIEGQITLVSPEAPSPPMIRITAARIVSTVPERKTVTSPVSSAPSEQASPLPPTEPQEPLPANDGGKIF